MSETHACEKCGAECDRHEVDVGVGVIYGPWGCPGCGWSEDEQYDLTLRDAVDEQGGAVDQYGAYHPPGSSMARAYRMAAEMRPIDDLEG